MERPKQSRPAVRTAGSTKGEPRRSRNVKPCNKTNYRAFIFILGLLDLLMCQVYVPSKEKIIEKKNYFFAEKKVQCKKQWKETAERLS